MQLNSYENSSNLILTLSGTSYPPLEILRKRKKKKYLKESKGNESFKNILEIIVCF